MAFAAITAVDPASCSVLLLDDCDSMRTLFAETFAHCAWELLFARTVEEARFVMTDRQPAVVFIDVMLQGQHVGLDFCRELTMAAGGDPLAPARFVISGLTAPEDVAAARESGADGYLLKPFSPMQLLSLMDVVTVWRISGRERPRHMWPYARPE